MIFFYDRKYAWFPSYTTENDHSQNLQDFTQWVWERHSKISHSVSHSVLLHSEMLLQKVKTFPIMLRSTLHNSAALCLKKHY